MSTQMYKLCFVLTLFALPFTTLAQDVVPPAATDEQQETEHAASEFPLVYSTDFEDTIEDWQLVDDGWGHKTNEDENKVLSLHKKESNYKPEVRCPRHQALLQDVTVTDFQFDLRVLSTHKDYPHRDCILIFGYQSPTEFYYVHLGKATDKHCNQIFIVNNAARTKISVTTNEGTAWNDQWHNVRIKRDVESGEIEIYFDDMETPCMTALDKTFVFGGIGVGSFDDTADFDDIKLYGTEYVEAEQDETEETEAEDAK